MSRLANHVCVVTGATGIAAAATRRLLAAGASVFTISLDQAECEALHRDLGSAADAHGWATADLTDETSTVEAFQACIDRFGKIDGLLAVAGGSGRRFGDGPLHTISLEAWQATLDLNLTTSFLSVREAIKHMLEEPEPQGSVVIISSVLAQHPSAERFSTHAYAAAKGAQLALVQAAAARYAPQQIRINAIAPGLVATPMSARAQQDDDLLAYLTTKQPLSGGMLAPGDVAEAALFFLSDESRYITGQTLAVDGGWSVTEAPS
ncbi:MAG: SDR family NAD(P)-dependent oxidoreductase [Acidimicrobiia bacterium]